MEAEHAEAINLDSDEEIETVTRTGEAPAALDDTSRFARTLASGTRASSSKWLLTWPRCTTPAQTVLDRIRAFKPVKWCVVSRELHADGFPHLHCVVWFASPIRLRRLDWPDAFAGKHGNYKIATRIRGALKYIVKDGNFVSHGIDVDEYLADTSSKRGAKWLEAATVLRSGGDLCAVEELDPGFFAMNCGKLTEYSDWVRSARPTHRVGEFSVKVLVLWGVTNTGKSHWARTSFPDAYSLPEPKSGVLWMTGYRGEKVLLIDDVDMSKISLRSLLKICDKWPQRVYVHGHTVMADWTTVIICNNEPPYRWYKDEPAAALQALNRRLNILQIDERNDLNANWRHPERGYAPQSLESLIEESLPGLDTNGGLL